MFSLREVSTSFLSSPSFLDNYRKFCQHDSWFACKPLDRPGHSEKQANDSGHSWSGASGYQHRGLPQSETIQQGKVSAIQKPFLAIRKAKENLGSKGRLCHYKILWGWKERQNVLPTGDGETSLLKLLLTLERQKSAC